MRLFNFMGYLYRSYPRLMSVYVLVLLTMSLVEVASILTVAPVIDMLTKEAGGTQSLVTEYLTVFLDHIGIPVTIGWLLLCFLLLNVAKSLIQVGALYVQLWTKYRILKDVLIGSFDDFIHAKWAFFATRQQGVLLNTLFRESEVLTTAFNSMARLQASAIQAGILMLLPMLLAWKVTVVSVGTGLVLAIPFILIGRLSYRFGQENLRTANEMTTRIQENLGMARVVQGYANQDRAVDDCSSAFDAHRRATIPSQILSQGIPMLYFPFGLCILITAVLSAQHFGIPFSTVSVMVYSLYRVAPALGVITGEKSVIETAYAGYRQIVDLRQAARDLRLPDGGKPFVGLKNSIDFRDVGFSYDADRRVLDGVTIQVPRRKMVALVGGSGAGKSTMIDLLLGFAEPQSGAIEVDGVDLRELDLASYRTRIGYVPQESVLYNASLRDNLLWSKPDASQAEMEAACRLANAHDFIVEFREGYETLVGDRGVRLSGGQLQRVALARALIRQPELLVLDEATSSLDTQSERLIQAAIDQVAQETTVVVVAHRLSTITKADLVYVMDGGRVVESGSYAELKDRGGAFTRMLQMQALTHDVAL